VQSRLAFVLNRNALRYRPPTPTTIASGRIALATAPKLLAALLDDDHSRRLVVLLVDETA
jgi:hypothetical protein